MIPPLPQKIDYKIIADALEFYRSRGYTEMEVPWIVSDEAKMVTAPEKDKPFRTHLGTLVASAEQSFVELMLHHTLRAGKYVSCTPCYRDEIRDDLHHCWFLKVELIDVLSEEQLSNGEINLQLNEMIESAESFFKRYLPIRRKETREGVDLICGDQPWELGSYGFRSYQHLNWIYGTGVAEPRLSIALSKQPKGYHLSTFPRGEYGEISKIEEEISELKDALSQENPIMALTELSDLVGAVQALLEARFPYISAEELLRMTEATRRAFKSGHR
ncbi:hypothetical protein HY496_00025 [Candidatus Woesearchaeota archaeon]|nr:hypothetical protein [Candidatus Woesearchaeota archaeon]